MDFRFMKIKRKNTGSVMLISVFVIALLSALVSGMLQMNTEEIQLMQNQIYAVQAVNVAEAGLNDALAQIRKDDQWVAGFVEKSFVGGAYTVTVTGTLPIRRIASAAVTAKGFTAGILADITIDTSGSGNHTIRIDELRIN